MRASPPLAAAAAAAAFPRSPQLAHLRFVNEDDAPYDPMRTARLASFGFFIHGSTGHYFYGFLDGKIPGAGPVQVASKVIIDQVFWNPIFGLMFFSYLGLVEGKSASEVVDKIKSDLKTAVMGSWAVWVPAHTINFAFVPPAQRLLYINTIQIGYNIFLSFLGNKKADAAALGDSAEKKDFDLDLDDIPSEVEAAKKEL